MPHLPIGTRIRVIHDFFYDSEAFNVGMEGTIVGMDGSYHQRYKIDWDEHRYHFHSCSGLCEQGHGYNIGDIPLNDHCEVVGELRTPVHEFQVGDTVRLTNVVGGLEIGHLGTIMYMYNNSRGDLCGVRWHIWYNGHNGSGDYMNTVSDNSIYNVVREDIALTTESSESSEEDLRETYTIEAFPVDTRIEVIREFRQDGISFTVGMTGEILDITGSHFLSIRWDHENYSFHTCDGSCDNRHGFNIDNERITGNMKPIYSLSRKNGEEKNDMKFKEGDILQVGDSSHRHIIAEVRDDKYYIKTFVGPTRSSWIKKDELTNDIKKIVIPHIDKELKEGEIVQIIGKCLNPSPMSRSNMGKYGRIAPVRSRYFSIIVFSDGGCGNYKKESLRLVDDGKIPYDCKEDERNAAATSYAYAYADAADARAASYAYADADGFYADGYAARAAALADAADARAADAWVAALADAMG
jgi:hypothetical protein